MLNSLASEFEYVFHGEHALGGRRTTAASVAAWWERVFQLLPGHRFEVQQILVNGPPWNTQVALHGRVTGTLPGGRPYENVLFQRMRIRWSQVTAIEPLENLQLLESDMEHMCSSGVSLAGAGPITDDP